MKKLKVRLYFRSDIIWFYQVINGNCDRDTGLIYALDRNDEQIKAKEKLVSMYGLAQKPLSISKTLDMRRRIIHGG